MRITFNALAERELNDAAEYYDLEQAGLGAAFITEVRRCTEAIQEHPDAGRLVLGNIRRRLCQRFPHALLYTVASNEIRILAVMNLRRRPGLVDNGLGKRLMYGSDQMIWPEVIGETIEAIERADFLTSEQKRDILYNNAARFLRLTEAEIAAHHGR